MAKNYIEQEKIALKEIFPTLNDINAYAMILSGLGEIKTDFGAQYYDTIVAEYASKGLDINSIISITSDYKTGNSGTTCSGTKIK